MKVLIQAMFCSVAIHIVYFISTMIIGYIKTKRYVPDMEAAWNNADNLPNEITISAPNFSPAFYFLSLVVVAILCGLIIALSERTFG
ncbi:hypothetical protein, partial [[Bacillus] enclensis]|uniref:hypothetical protein n=1 Tax=[Bacillus] enclensis TaxID=1402860 RepID=UPI0018DCF3D9